MKMKEGQRKGENLVLVGLDSFSLKSETCLGPFWLNLHQQGPWHSSFHQKKQVRRGSLKKQIYFLAVKIHGVVNGKHLLFAMLKFSPDREDISNRDKKKSTTCREDHEWAAPSQTAPPTGGTFAFTNMERNIAQHTTQGLRWLSTNWPQAQNPFICQLPTNL